MATASSPTRPYYHDFDAARSVLMMLGVLLHAANVYRSDSQWLVRDPTSPFFTWLSDAIHVFRMPAFFMISGFFCAMSLGRMPAGAFLRRRTVRIAVPLLTTALTLNSLQTWLLGEESVVESWRDGTWITHLWFLIFLLAYFPLAVAWRAAAAPVGAALVRVAQRAPGVVLLGLPLASLAVVVAAHPFDRRFEPVYGDLAPFTFVWYLPFFAAGALVHAAPRLMELLQRWCPAVFALALLVVAVEALDLTDGEGAARRALDTALDCTAPWVGCLAVFMAFHRFAARPSATWRWLSDGSYTVYLFHHLIVVALAMALLPAGLPGGLKFVVVVGVTVPATVAIHGCLVLRVPLLRFLFNGKLERPSAAGGPG